MSFGHALYYPYINLTNKNWLKNAFLYWDRLSRIVPYSVTPEDTEEIIKINYETNFINNYSPQDYVIDDAFHMFSEHLERMLANPRFKYSIAGRNHMRLSPLEYRQMEGNFDYRREVYSSIANKSGSYLHISKLNRRLLSKLINLGLAVPGEDEWHSWIKIENEIGYAYMAFLAKAISKNKSTPMVTDNEIFYSTSMAYEPQFRDYGAEFSYRLATLLIKHYLPRDINLVPIDTLIKIRNKYETERIAFAQYVTELSQSVPPIDNQSALEDALNHYEKYIVGQTENLRKIYESFGIETVGKFLAIQVPTSFASMTDCFPPEYRPLITAGGISFGIIQAISATKKERSQLRKEPLSYMLNISSKFNHTGLLDKINKTVSGLIKI